jgi:hypothetical protein
MFTPELCPKCNKPLKEYNNFCPWCGVKVEIKKIEKKSYPIVGYLAALIFFTFLFTFEIFFIQVYRNQIDQAFIWILQRMSSPFTGYSRSVEHGFSYLPGRYEMLMGTQKYF